MAKRKQAETVGYQALSEALRAGRLGNCYLLCGEERYGRALYLERMKKLLLTGPGADFNYHRFDRETLDWGQVSAAVEAMPMLSERTLVEIDDIDLYREPEAEREKLIAILEELPDYCCLVFVYDTVEFKPDRRLKKLQSAVERCVQVAEFTRLSAGELQKWARKQALAGGKDIDRETTDRLIFLTDGSMGAMASELEKLTAYAAGPVITRQDVDAVVEPTLNAVSFDLSNAVADGDYERALQKLRELLAMQEDAVMLLGAVSSQLRRLYYARLLLDRGRGPEALMKLCGMGAYPARLTMQAARRRSTAFCAAAATLCLETDRQLKRSYDEPQRLLELLLARLAQEDGR